MFRHEAYDKEQQNFNQQYDLSPVETLVLLKKLADIGGNGNAQCKKQDRNQIVDCLPKVVVKEILAEEYDIAGLGIGKHMPSGNISVYILQTTGYGQHGCGQKRFGHLSVFKITKSFKKIIFHNEVFFHFLILFFFANHYSMEEIKCK